MIDDYRLKQSNAQQIAIESRAQTKVTRASDRDKEYGFQNVIAPDGSISRDGIKTYNAEIPIGTPVLATERSDGLTALSSLKASPSNPLVPKIFGYPKPKKESLDLWGLGLQDIGGENGSRKLFLLNLKAGSSYPIAEWPRKIPPCPPAYPDPKDYPNWPNDYPDWRVSYSYTITSSYYGYDDPTANGTRSFDISGVGENGNYSLAGSFFGIVSGINEYGYYFWKLMHGSSVLESGGENDPRFSGTNTPFGNINPVLSNVSIADMTGGPPGNPDPSNPPPTEPRNNEAAYTLSLTTQGVPIARLRHTPQCKGTEYDFDKYFKLELIGGNLQIKDYPGDSVLGNWRTDPPNFRCKGDLSGNAFVEFSADRSFYWYAEASIGPYNRPEALILNAAPIEIKVSKIFTPDSGTCLITGINPRTVYSSYGGTGRPPTLTLVAIAGHGV